MNIVIEKFKKYTSGSGTNYIVLVGLLGIMLLTIGEINWDKTETSKTDVYYEDYKTDIENQLEKILSSVKGAGGVDVMVTLEAGQEIVYVQQEKTVKDQSNITGDKSDQQTIKDSYENEIVMIEENNQKQALVEKVLEPVVQGVVVVCGGADDISVVSDITNAVCIALNITSNRVCVIKMK